MSAFKTSVAGAAKSLSNLSARVLPFAIGLVLAGCQPPSTNPSGGPSSTPPTGGPVGSGDPIKLNGTVSGGGGNGIDGRMLESYSVNIATLPEYRRYIGPILRKMSHGRPDILVTYLEWAVRHKIWYMIPRPLPELPKEQTALAFSSDQLALHTEMAIYVHSPSYEKRTPKEKAELLMHEMVMGARLLMKKTPKEQCEALRSGDLKECESAEMMELAQVKAIPEAARMHLNGADHDSVRALTLFLLRPQQDFSGENISFARKKLGFEFPWDQAASELSMEDVALAYRRGRIGGDRLVQNGVDANGKAVDRQCFFQFRPMADGYFGSTVVIAMNESDEQEAVRQKSVVQSEDIPFENTVKLIPIFQKLKPFTNFNLDQVEARGAMDPRGGNKAVVDLVRVAPSTQWRYNITSYIFEFYLARENTPRLIEIRVIPVTAMVTDGFTEFVVNRREPPSRCLLAP